VACAGARQSPAGRGTRRHGRRASRPGRRARSWSQLSWARGMIGRGTVAVPCRSSFSLHLLQFVICFCTQTIAHKLGLQSSLSVLQNITCSGSLSACLLYAWARLINCCINHELLLQSWRRFSTEGREPRDKADSFPRLVWQW
jgi:hypothetical protein